MKMSWTCSLVWMNSEGRTKAWAMNPQDGTTRARLPLGLHMESTYASDVKGTVLMSRALSSILAVVDCVSGTAQVLDHPLRHLERLQLPNVS